MYTRVYTCVYFLYVCVLSKMIRIAYCTCNARVCVRARAYIYKYINIWFAPPRPRALIYGDPPVSLICGRFRNCMCHDPFYSTLGSNPLLLYLEERYTVIFLRETQWGRMYRFFFFFFFFTHWIVRSFLRVRFYSSEIDVFMAVR